MFSIYTYNDTEYISACIKRDGVWEPGVTAFLKGLAEREKDSPILFVDIGANIGYFSLLMASQGVHI